MRKSTPTGGDRRIYEHLIDRLHDLDIATSAEHLDLELNEAGEVRVPFLGTTFLISNEGVRRADGKDVRDTTGSVLIRYISEGSLFRPAGKLVTLAQLAGPVFRRGSYSSSALERPIIKRFQGRVPELLARAAAYGGRRGGEAGSGSVSLIFELLPHIPMQLIFYDRDEEFPARTTLLFDPNSARVLDFESLAVLVTIFVQSLTKP